MEQILIRIKNKEKAQLLFELLSALDFVELVETDSPEAAETAAGSADFFALAGLWEDREITLDSIRQQAWPRQRHGTV